MTTELWLMLCIAFMVVIVAAIAFVCSIFADKVEKERLLLQSPDFTSLAGFSVNELPQEDFLRLDRVYLLGRKIGQLEFYIQPNWTAVLRVAPQTTDLKMWEIGTQEYDQLIVRTVDGIRTELRQVQNGAAMAYWKREGFAYGLYLPRTEMGLAGAVMQQFVTACRSSLNR